MSIFKCLLLQENWGPRRQNPPKIKYFTDRIVGKSSISQVNKNNTETIHFFDDAYFGGADKPPYSACHFFTLQMFKILMWLSLQCHHQRKFKSEDSFVQSFFQSKISPHC